MRTCLPNPNLWPNDLLIRGISAPFKVLLLVLKGYCMICGFGLEVLFTWGDLHYQGDGMIIITYSLAGPLRDDETSSWSTQGDVGKSD